MESQYEGKLKMINESQTHSKNQFYKLNYHLKKNCNQIHLHFTRRSEKKDIFIAFCLTEL